MDRPGGGRDEAEGSEARARVGATGGGAGRDRGGRWARGPRQASIVLLRRGCRAVASNDPQMAPALGSFETAPGWPRIAGPSRCHA